MVENEKLESFKNEIENVLGWGKGYSIYNATIESVSKFEEILSEKSLVYQTVILSNSIETEQKINGVNCKG